MWQVLTTLDGPNDEGMRRRWEVNVAELLELWPLALQQHLPLLVPAPLSRLALCFARHLMHYYGAELPAPRVIAMVKQRSKANPAHRVEVLRWGCVARSCLRNQGLVRAPHEH